MFMTSDRASFAFLEKIDKALAKDTKVLAEVITRGTSRPVWWSAMSASGERRCLISTLGHALEKCSGYTLLHGQAVGVGILVEARLAISTARRRTHRFR